MKKEFKNVAKLVELDEKVNNATVSLHLNKLAEEFGEFAQGINKTLGIKSVNKNETDKMIKDNICEEAIDMIQIIAGLAHLNGISYKDLMKKFNQKNKAYKKYIDKKSKK
jgi:NTP pyrophosphatase (non-canonical NTP hydrolase)